MAWQPSGRVVNCISYHPSLSIPLSLFALTPLTQFQEPRESKAFSGAAPPILTRRAAVAIAICYVRVLLRIRLFVSDLAILAVCRHVRSFMDFIGGPPRAPARGLANFNQRHDANAHSAFDIPSRCSFRGRAQLWSRRTWTTCLSGGGHIGKVAYEYHSDWRMKPLNAAVPPKKEMPRFQQRVTPRADVLRKLSTVGEKQRTRTRHATPLAPKGIRLLLYDLIAVVRSSWRTARGMR